MPTFRTLRLLVLTAGVLGATACQRDKPARTEQAAPALSDTLNLDSLDSAIGSQPSATPIRRDWHRLTKRTNPRAPLIVYRSVRRAPAGFDSTPPPGQATLFDVARKASEYFQIDPTKAAEVRGRDGTVVRIGAGTLVDAQQRPAKGPVWVELKECYSLAEMLTTNLSTLTDDGQPLQTAGMVLVRATATGRPLQVAAGRTVRLEMPATNDRPQPDMRLYYGTPTAPVRWVAAPEAAPEASSETIYADASPMPAFGKGPADLNRLIRYPREAVANGTQGVVFASFVVNEQGRVLRPRILRGLGSGCDEEVLRILRQTSGRWTPGQRQGEFVKVKMVLPIRFSFHPGQLSTADSSAPAARETAPVQETAQLSDAADEEEEAAPADRYVFRCAQLGWFNADRPWAGAGTATLLAPAEPNDATSLRLIFRGATPTVLAGQAVEGGYQFDKLPAGRRAVLVGLRYQGDIPYVAWQELTTGRTAPDSLEFRETTLAELEQRLEKLN